MNIKKVGICSLLFLIVACSSAHAGVTLINGQVLGNYLSAVTWLGSMDGGGYDLTNVDELNATKFNQNGNDVLDTTDNTSMAGYVDSQDTAFNTSIRSYVDSQNGVYNTSMKSYADAQDVAYNTSMGSYVDSQDTTYNASMKSYADETFLPKVTANGDGNVLYLSFNEKSGSIAYDSSPESNDGTVTDAPIVSGKFGNGRYFDGDGDYIDCGSDSSLDFDNTTSFSICTRIFAGAVDDSDRIVGKQSTGYYIIRIKNNATRFAITGSDSGYLNIEGTTLVNDSNWHHVCALYNVSEDTGYLYLDSSLEGSDYSNMGGDFGSSASLYVGRYGNDYYTGTMDEVKIWNRVLTVEEIRAEYNLGLASASADGHLMPKTGGNFTDTVYFDFGIRGCWRGSTGSVIGCVCGNSTDHFFVTNNESDCYA